MKIKKKSFYCSEVLKVGILSIFLLLFCLPSLFSQETVVKGVVLDEKDSPFNGVSVVEMGAKNGTMSDIDGRFSISVKNVQKSVLKFSCIGYKTKMVVVNGHKSLTVHMQEEVTTLGEVVAIGYGTVKKRDLTGSVASIKGDELLKTSPVNVNGSFAF